MPEAVMEVPNSPKVKRLLYKGREGADVKYVQECLDTINTMQPFRPFDDELPNSGKFGRMTLHFVQSFQIYCGIPTHGWVDKTTMSEIEKRIDRINKKYQYDPFDIY